MARMTGRALPKSAVGPGGKGCTCCYPPPGKARALMKRSTKRREERQWKKEQP